MDRKKHRRLLRDFQRGDTTIDSLLAQLQVLPYEDIGFASIDHHRDIRQHIPEVIFCPGKTIEQIVEIASRLHQHGLPKPLARTFHYSSETLLAPISYLKRALCAVSHPLCAQDN